MIDDQAYLDMLETRARYPTRIADAVADRKPGPALALLDSMVVVAIDHPARRILGVGTDPMAMADRRELLDRTVRALRRDGVDGILATPDIIDDLLLLGELDGKIVFGSMNRSGLTGSAWELDDRMSAYDAETLQANRFDGGKMLVRFADDAPGVLSTMQAGVAAVTALASRNLVALVEPLPVRRRDDRSGYAVVTETPALVEAISVVAAWGPTSAYTWLKLPATDDMHSVMASTTLPTLLLGGDPESEGTELLARWRDAMQIPHVRGLVAGRSLLYPTDGNVERAVDTAVAITHGGRS